MTKVYLLDGKLIGVGDWVCLFEPDEDGNLIASNPLPEGAVEADVALAATARGSIVLADDYEALRYDEYPPMRDQLDALWKGGDAATEMAAQVQAIKDKYPKP
jgi:hypothetical protein